MTVEIREATEEDVRNIRHVAERAWYEAHAPIIGKELTAEFLEKYYDAKSLRDVVSRDEWITRVADTGEGVVGFVSGGPDEDEPELVHLNRVYIDPEYWGRGIGGQLLEEFEQRATRRESERITLHVMVENEQAVGFYESAGFEREEEVYDEMVETNSYVYVKEL